MIQSLRSRLPERPNAEQKRGLELQIYRAMYGPMMVASVLTMVFELYMIISAVLKSGAAFSSPFRFWYLGLYIFLFLAALFCVIYFHCNRRKMEKDARMFHVVCYGLAWVVCLWGSLITALSHRTDADISVYLYVVLSAAILIFMSPGKAAVLFSVNACVFLVLMFYFKAPELDPYSSIVNGIFASALGILLSCVLYYNRLSVYLNGRTIEAQNLKIEQQNAMLQKLVITDELTAVHNRRFLERNLPEILNRARESGQGAAILMIDIDYFKQYNDIYGHGAGDECLRQIAGIIRSCLPSDRGYLARYGGEEFVALVTKTDEQEAGDFAERIRSAVEQGKIPHEGQALGVVTISVGVCLSPPGGKSGIDQLIRYADDALYRAKSEGRNCIRFFQAEE